MKIYEILLTCLLKISMVVDLCGIYDLDIFSKMTDNDNQHVPVILDRIYFKIVSVEGDKVLAKCVNCVNKTIF